MRYCERGLANPALAAPIASDTSVGKANTEQKGCQLPVVYQYPCTGLYRPLSAQVKAVDVGNSRAKASQQTV